MLNKVISRNFLRSLFFVQNEHHKHGVFFHTVKVVYHCVKNNRWDLVPTALFHDIGKPYCANQRKQSDKDLDIYSFDNHEEFSWYIVKNWKFLSDKTKLLIRWHYLIRGTEKAQQKGKLKKYQRLSKKWNMLSDDIKADLLVFKVFDDLAKQ